jgi:hypothetical protein
MRTALWIATLLFGTIILATSARASSFCVVDFAGKRCWFNDYPSCLHAAGEKGACIVNTESFPQPQGQAPFCLVEGGGVQCNHFSQSECEKQASARQLLCIPNPTQH